VFKQITTACISCSWLVERFVDGFRSEGKIHMIVWIVMQIRPFVYCNIWWSDTFLSCNVFNIFEKKTKTTCVKTYEIACLKRNEFFFSSSSHIYIFFFFFFQIKQCSSSLTDLAPHRISVSNKKVQ
jgi:hypothetical protein